MDERSHDTSESPQTPPSATCPRAEPPVGQPNPQPPQQIARHDHAAGPTPWQLPYGPPAHGVPPAGGGTPPTHPAPPPPGGAGHTYWGSPPHVQSVPVAGHVQSVPTAGHGQWGPPSWPPSGAVPWQTPSPAPRKKRTKAVFAIALAWCVVFAAGIGALVGHQLWGTPVTNNPFQSTGSNFSTKGGSSSSGSGQKTTVPSGSPPAEIAAHVDAALVDIDTTLNYEQLEGAGTGMVLTSTGLILTNNHVVEGATSISVTDIGNGKTYSATVVGYDRSADVALLQLKNASGLTTVTLASGTSQNEQVVAIGNAGGKGGTPTYATGKVTALDQSITASDEATGASEQLTGLIETDANIVPGDSGGPLVNSSGQVVGMDTAAAQGFQFQSSGDQGYAIPIAKAESVAGAIATGTSSSTVHVGPTAFLGVEVTNAESSDGANAAGAQIASVVSNGPAADAGLQEGDTITSLGGNSVVSPEALTNAMLTEKPGDSVRVQYVDAEGNQQSATVQLGSGPPQ